MPKMISSRELADFLNDVWPVTEDRWYIDLLEDDLDILEFVLTVDDRYEPKLEDGVPIMVPYAVLRTTLFWQGNARETKPQHNRCIEPLYKAWKKRQTYETLVVSVPKDKVEELKQFIKMIKGSIS